MTQLPARGTAVGMPEVLYSFPQCIQTLLASGHAANLRQWHGEVNGCVGGEVITIAGA
jgi:hypothetical protein